MLLKCLTQSTDENSPEKFIKKIFSGACGCHPFFETKII